MTTPLIFVAGNSRSGTTMVARMLELHSAIHTLREVHFFEELWLPADKGKLLDPDAAITLAQTLIQRARERYQHGGEPGKHLAEATAVVDGMSGPLTGERVFAATLREQAASVGKTIACEQTPRNIYFAREILDLFDDAVVVAVIRDPRDVLASQKNWWRKSEQDGERIARLVRLRHWANYHPWLTSLLWRSGARAQLGIADLDRVVSIRYEDIITDAANELRKVTDKLGLDFDPAMLAVRRFGSSLKSDEETTGIDASRAGGWHTQLRPSEVWISQRVAAAEYTTFGYPVESMPTPYAGIAASSLLLPAKLALAFALNVRRSRNVLSSVKRRLSR